MNDSDLQWRDMGFHDTHIRDILHAESTVKPLSFLITIQTMLAHAFIPAKVPPRNSIMSGKKATSADVASFEVMTSSVSSTMLEATVCTSLSDCPSEMAKKMLRSRTAQWVTRAASRMEFDGRRWIN
jgi:hypothetical protein